MNRKLITCGRLFRLCGLHRWAQATQPPGNVRVTYTHGVRRADMEHFDLTVRFLRQRRAFLTPAQFFNAYRNSQAFAGPLLLLTFDDGFQSAYFAAREVLDGHGIKAVFFVPTMIVAAGKRTLRRLAARILRPDVRDGAGVSDEDCAFMTAEQLAELSENGHLVCPHTHSHVRLRDITDRELARRELVLPKRILENLLGRTVEAIAFPVGTERQVSAYAYGCIRAIYNFCFTALNGPNTLTTDPYRLHRDCLPAEAPLAYVQMVMDGTYDLFYRLKMRRLTRLTRGRPDSRAAMPGPNRALRPSLPAALGPSGTGSQRAGNSPP